MRRWGTVLPMLLCACLTGCFTSDTVRSQSWLARIRTPRLALGPDGVLLDLVLLELPVDSKLLNSELWPCADCQAIGLERQGMLADNGLRVGPIIGTIPGPLQAELTTERHWFKKDRQILAAGSKMTIALGEPLPHCNFHLRTEAGTSEVALNQGQTTLVIEPSLTEDGRTRLKFTPQVLYGAVAPDYQAGSEGWQLEFKRPNKTYSSLSWEVSLAPNQYLIVGTHLDEQGDVMQTFGGQCFLQDTNHGAVQRLLVLRTARGDSGLSADWSVAKGQMPEAGSQEDGSPADSEALPLTPAAACWASSRN
jgi:hypothetical protein